MIEKTFDELKNGDFVYLNCVECKIQNIHTSKSLDDNKEFLRIDIINENENNVELFVVEKESSSLPINNNSFVFLIHKDNKKINKYKNNKMFNIDYKLDDGYAIVKTKISTIGESI